MPHPTSKAAHKDSWELPAAPGGDALNYSVAVVPNTKEKHVTVFLAADMVEGMAPNAQDRETLDIIGGNLSAAARMPLPKGGPSLQPVPSRMPEGAVRYQRRLEFQADDPKRLAAQMAECMAHNPTRVVSDPRLAPGLRLDQAHSQAHKPHTR